ncbi:MAG: S41 family peptidase [Parcubacteria group bacterium]
MPDFLKNRNNIILLILVIGGIFFSGFYFGSKSQGENTRVYTLINKTASSTTTEIDFEPFWKAWEVINEKYVSSNSTTTEPVDDQARVYGAIEGMVASLGDPYTVFFPPVETKAFNEEISGQLEGVGMEVDVRNGVLTVIAPVKGTPAYRAGVKPGDKILKINDSSTAGLSTQQAIKLIRGKKGTTVKLNMLREGTKDPFDLSIVRDFINLPTVDTETKGDVFIIRLYSFSAISPDLFRQALREFYESGHNKLIIDLRGNPGGYLEAAIDMASWFLPTGAVVVKEDFRNQQDAKVFRSKGYNIFNDNLELVVMIDGGSASASEILAGALHEQGIATLVGTQSFGKGSVQELVDITPETSLKVTIARWLTPNGKSISHGGLTPDVVVKLNEEAYKKDKTDTQLNKALEILAQ